MSLLKIINISDPGTGFRFGGDDLDEVNRILSGEDRGKLIKFENIVYFGGAQKFRVLRPNGTNWVSFNSEAETANRAILVPLLGADQRMVFEALSQPLSNKQINFANNTPTNFPGAAINNASVDGAKLIDASVNGGKLIDNTVLDAKINGVAFAKITGQIAMSQITDNTITNAKLVQITDVSKIQDGLITSAKIADGTIVNADINSAAAIDILKTDRLNAQWEKNGKLSFIHPNQVIGQGLLESIQAYYSTYTITQNLNKTFGAFATGTTANTAAGVATHNSQGILRRSWNPFTLCRASLPALSSADSSFYFGYTSRTNSLLDPTTPLANNETGFLIGYRPTDANYQVFHNDGAGSPATVVNTGLAVQVATSTNTFIINMTASAIAWFIYNSGKTVLASGSINTGALPATTTNLNYQTLLYNPTGVSKSLSMQNVDIRTDG